MTDFGLTPEGLRIETIADIVPEYETIYRALFGAGIPLGASTTFGKEIKINSEREALIWELLEAINDAFDPDKATDNALDRLLKIIGLLRLQATRSTNVVYAAGTADSTVASGSLFAVQDTLDQFRVISTIDLGAIETVALTALTRSGGTATGATGAPHGLVVGDLVFVGGAVISQVDNVDVTTVADDTLYTVTINDVPFSITSDGSATDTEIRDALIAGINAGSEPVTAAPGGSSDLDITADVPGAAFTITVTANLTNTQTRANVTEAGSQFNGLHEVLSTPTAPTFTYAIDAGTLEPAEGTLTFDGTTPIPVESVDTGAVGAPIGSLTVIVNNISGLDRIENAVAATPGRDVETDLEAKERRDESAGFTGASSVPSLRARLRNLSGVTAARVIENDLDTNVIESVAIIGVVDGAGGSFTISGNNLLFFTPLGPNEDFPVDNSTGNDGDYTIDTVELVSGNTRITVNENVPSGVADGNISIITLTPHSIESILTGGDDQEIAQTIYDFGGGGIQTIGASNEEDIDDDGEIEKVRFSRPSDVDADVVIVFTADPEKEAPVESEIIAAVEAYGEGLNVGDDMIIDLIEAVGRLSTTGIKTLSATLNGGSSDIPVSNRQQASFTSVTTP